MPRPIRPLLVAPLIPLLGIVGVFGVDQLHGTSYLTEFVIVWCILLAVLFRYVLARALAARRLRRPGPGETATSRR